MAEYIKKEHPTLLTPAEIKEVMSYVDLTSLNPSESEESLMNLCLKANSSYGSVATVCIYPHNVALVAQLLMHSSVKITSVANFPSGQESLSDSLKNIELAIQSGADEIDMVFPYQSYLNGQQSAAINYIQAAKKACDHTILKVIIETSEFTDLAKLYSLCLKILDCEVNFIKTSTGKSKQGATIEGASVMLLAIKAHNQEVGFKASGGIRSFEQACTYMDLAKKILGVDWVNPNRFRIGTSGLSLTCA